MFLDVIIDKILCTKQLHAGYRPEYFAYLFLHSGGRQCFAAEEAKRPKLQNIAVIIITQP